jgi:voltage-gated potassium channel Kch
MHAGWWTVMTMTTVGYGDILPRTTSGALLGYVTMLTGMLSVALPISVLSSTFASKYEQFTKDKGDSKVRYLCPDRHHMNLGASTCLIHSTHLLKAVKL